MIEKSHYQVVGMLKLVESLATKAKRAGEIHTEEAARRYAKFLIHELASSGSYSSRPCLLEVKDENGPLFSTPFRETAT